VTPFTLLSAGHGGDAVKFAQVMLRPLCSNLLRAAFTSARGGVFTMKHTRNVRDRVEIAAGIMRAAAESRRAWTAAARRMATVRISAQMAQDLAFSALDIDADEARKGGRIGAKADEVRARLSRSINAPGTVWGALNAVTEFTTHSDRAGRSRGAERLMSSVDGTADAANQKAWNAALELVGAV